MIRLAVFASGQGTNCENLIRYFAQSNLAQVTLVLSNHTNAPVLERASRLHVEVLSLDRQQFSDAATLLPILRYHRIDFIVLAGFLLMIPDFLIKAYDHRMVNIHPALLPKHGGKGMYGRHVHEAVKAAGDNTTGFTVHWVSPVCDGGEIIEQRSVGILPSDTVDDIASKEHELEMEYFPPSLRTYCGGRIPQPKLDKSVRKGTKRKARHTTIKAELPTRSSAFCSSLFLLFYHHQTCAKSLFIHAQDSLSSTETTTERGTLRHTTVGTVVPASAGLTTWTHTIRSLRAPHRIAHISASLTAAKDVHAIGDAQQGVACDSICPSIRARVGRDIPAEVALLGQYVIEAQHHYKFSALQESLRYLSIPYEFIGVHRSIVEASSAVHPEVAREPHSPRSLHLNVHAIIEAPGIEVTLGLQHVARMLIAQMPTGRDIEPVVMKAEIQPLAELSGAHKVLL